jgi:hypothetical protein
LPPDQRPSLDHPCGVQTITAVKITLPVSVFSPEIMAIQDLVELEYGETYHLQLEMDRGNRHHSFAPELPLSIRY